MPTHHTHAREPTALAAGFGNWISDSPAPEASVRIGTFVCTETPNPKHQRGDKSHGSSLTLRVGIGTAVASMTRMALVSIWLSPFFATSATATDSPAFVMTLDGETHSDNITRITDGTIHHQSGQQTPLTDLLRIETGQPPDNRLIQSLVVMTNGDRLAVDIIRLRDDLLVCRTFADHDLEIPIEFVRAFVLKFPRSTRRRLELLSLIDTHQQKDDIILIENGDRITGELLDLGPSDAVLETASGEVRAPRAGIRAIAMNVDLATPIEPPDDSYQIVLLTDGSSLSVQSLELTDEILTGTALFNSKVRIALKQVAAIFARGPRIVPLSQLKPEKWTYTPFLAGSRQLELNRNSFGQDLRLSRRRYPQGLGMHSRSAANWELNGQYSAFVSDFGIDDLANGRGSVEFHVTVDDRVEFKSKVIGKSPRQSTGLIDLTGASHLKLDVDYAIRGDLFDIANWCEPVLIRK